MIPRTFRSIALTVAGFASLSSFSLLHLNAQVAPSLVTNRLTQPIDESSLVRLKGTVHPLANAANDRGAAPDSMPLDRIQIILKRSAAQEAALQQVIHDEHTSGSASYHKWLTPDQFARQFGPSDQDVATLESWLASKGLNVGKVNPGKQTLEVSGNVAQFRSAFHAQIHQYAVNGETHFANATDPQIPAALAPVFGGFVSLNNFRPHSMSHVLGHATYNPKTGQATPQWTYGNSSGVNFVLAPSDFAVQYNLPSTLDGSGQTIAIINDSNINVATVNQFRSLFSLPVNPPQVIIAGNDPGVDGINNPDGPNNNSVEAYLDVEWAGAVAPKARIDLVVGADTALETGLILAAEHAIYGNIAPVVSISFGFGCEAQMGSFNQFVDALLEQAAAQGITVMVSTGDNASAGCDNDNSQFYAVGGAAVSGLASTPFDVAVGGTDFFYSSFNQGSTAINNQIVTYWNTAPSQNPSTSIKGFVPEQPWNNSQYGLNLFSIDSTNQQTTIAGGSGGASSCVTGTPANGSFTTCTAGYAKPVWQSGHGVPADKVRDIPDVSLFAANGLNASFYPICFDDGDCQPPSGSNLVQITGIGGTSASSPAFAGIMALVNERYGRQGQADYVLYPLAAQFPAAFHDVTNGTNSVPCAFSATNDSPNCIAVSHQLTVTDPNLGTAVEGQLGSGTTADYNATAGYDLATGLGSVDATQLIDDWGSVTFPGSSVSLTSPTGGATFTHGASVSFAGTVTGTGGSTPTGDVALETDSTEPGQQSRNLATLSSGAFSVSTTTLPGGTYDIWANYAGDSKNAAADSQKAQITVNPESSGVFFAIDDIATGRAAAGPAINSGATNVSYGTQLMLSAQVAPGSQLTALENCNTGASATCPSFTAPTGTVVFKDNSADLNTTVLNVEGDAEFNAPFAVGSHSVTASYSGDSSYNPSAAAAIAFSVVKNTPQISVLSSVVTQFLPTGQANVFTVQVLNSANLGSESAFNAGFSAPVAPPTGTVTISGFPSGVPTNATLTAGVDPQTLAPAGIGTITIPATIAAGNYNVTVTYNGDGNYNTTTFAATIPVQSAGGVATTTTAAISGSISPTSTVSISGTVTGKSGDGAPSNADGGILIYSGGYYIAEIPVSSASSDSSSFSITMSSRSLLQGSNTITVQYAGDSKYAPSSVTLTPAISNPLSDFTMVPNTTIVPVTVGTAATDPIQLSPVNGFGNSVSFTCTAPSGITCSLSPTSYVFSGGPSTATLTLNASGSATNGANNLLVTGTDSSGKFVHTLSIQADVAGATTASAAFTLNASPSTITIAPGATVTNAGIGVTPANGFSGNVALTSAVTGPSGATSIPIVTINTSPLDVTGQSAISSGMSIATTSSTTLGNYTVTLTGTSGAAMETATLNLIVATPPPSSFTLSNSGGITIASPGGSGTSTLTVTPANSFTGAVNFTCAVTTSPAGATDMPACTAPAANVTGSANATATLTVTTTAGTTAALRNPLDKLFAAGGGLVVAGLLFFGIPARRRSWRSILAVLVFAGIVGMGIGCGSSGGNKGSGGGGTTGGTSTGAYVLTVTGTSGSLSETTTVNLTVN
ncbi:MAG TPA: Ig-like domain repeat protein [Silvibacterium sp.]|nr:Ig-like domain repeat protein [Silvibacterium sp.]